MSQRVERKSDFGNYGSSSSRPFEEEKKWDTRSIERAANNSIRAVSVNIQPHIPSGRGTNFSSTRSSNRLEILSERNRMLETKRDQEDEKIQIVPGESIGDLKIGMSREDLFKVLKKDLTTSEDVDYFDDLGLRVEYENNQVTLLESDATRPLFLDENSDIFSISSDDCVALIKNKDPKASVDGEMIQSEKLGLGIKINQFDGDQPPSLVGIFAKKA